MLDYPPDYARSFRRSQHRHLVLRASLLLLTLVGEILCATAMAKQCVDWDALNLNSDQSSRIQSIESEWKTTAHQILPQLNQDKSELMQLLNSPQSDGARIQELQARINSNKARLQNAAMQSYLKKKEQLTPDQQLHLQQMITPNGFPTAAPPETNQ